MNFLISLIDLFFLSIDWTLPVPSPESGDMSTRLLLDRIGPVRVGFSIAPSDTLEGKASSTTLLLPVSYSAPSYNIQYMLNEPALPVEDIRFLSGQVLFPCRRFHILFTGNQVNMYLKIYIDDYNLSMAKQHAHIWFILNCSTSRGL